VAEHAPGAGLQRPQGANRPAQVNEDGGEQGAAPVAAAGAVAGLHRVERARSNAEAHGAGCGQDREAVDQSGIEPGHHHVFELGECHPQLHALHAIYHLGCRSHQPLLLFNIPHPPRHESGGQEGGTAVDAEDLACGVEHMGIAGDRAEADACDWSQGMLAVAATDHFMGMDDVATQALGDEADGEGVGQGLASVAARVSGADVGEVD